MCAQITHAAGESIEKELPPGTNAVVLECENETQLRGIAKKLSLAGIPHIPIQEIDPPWNGQMTAIGCVPLNDRSVIKKILSSLPLLGSRKALGVRKDTPSANAQTLVESPVE
jgi:hypothetical protein